MTDGVEAVRALVEHVTRVLALDARVDVEERDGEVHVDVVLDDASAFIGRHGQVIDAVQHLAFKVASQAVGAPVRVCVDAGGYRARRRERLEQQADAAAVQALATGAAVSLEAMSSVDRRIVHERLKDREDLRTYSQGSEPGRHLVVAPAGDA